MKLSSVTKDRLLTMSLEQKWNFNCGGIHDDGESADVALLLGTNPELAIERAKAAAQLYLSGRVPMIVASGGVKWDYHGEKISEADLMAQILQENGVPTDAILLDNEARTTQENMICSALQINRKNKFYTVDKVIIVTSLTHMKRSLALAKAFLPRKVIVSAYPVPLSQSKEDWLKSEENVKNLTASIRLLKELVDHRVIEDMDIDL